MNACAPCFTRRTVLCPTDGGEKHEIADDAILEAFVLHRRASVLDHDSLTRETLQVRKRLGEHGDALEIVERAFVIDCGGGGAGTDRGASGGTHRSDALTRL